MRNVFVIVFAIAVLLLAVSPDLFMTGYVVGVYFPVVVSLYFMSRRSSC